MMTLSPEGSKTDGATEETQLQCKVSEQPRLVPNRISSSEIRVQHAEYALALPINSLFNLENVT